MRFDACAEGGSSSGRGVGDSDAAMLKADDYVKQNGIEILLCQPAVKWDCQEEQLQLRRYYVQRTSAGIYTCIGESGEGAKG